MQTKRFVEPTEEQYLILNALETLELLQYRLYDEYTGNWLIITPSPILPTSFLLPDGDVVPSTWVSET
ncbi:MAG TPA: hypothetical protein V6D14_27915 [Coleofasciculaceae cyanobacterium]|jgi:hypothetical protein